MKYLLALDQGTTSSRAIVFDADGGSLAVAQREFRQFFPQDGWVEHDAVEIWETQLDVAREALAKAGLKAADISAIGITNQRETTVVWERKGGRPLCPAIVWQDRRTAALTEDLKTSGLQTEVAERTGLVLDPYFSGTKLKWILDNIPDARRRAEEGELAFGAIDSWLLWQLTGGKVHATDVSNASRTLLMDLTRCQWEPRMLDLLDIPEAVLPRIRPSSAILGECVVSDLEGIPIAGMAGDQHAALFGQACFSQGSAKNTYGTGSFLLMHAGETPPPTCAGLLRTVAWQLGEERVEYALEGSVFVTGALIQWLRDGLGIISQAPEVEELARSVDDPGGVCVVPAFAGLGAPHWDPYARGTISGITRGTSKAHIARASLEAIAFQCAEVLETMERDGGLKLGELRVDGGASRNNLLMQIQADVLGVPVIRPAQTETTALGAAYLAGLAVGVFRSQEDIADRWKLEREFRPAAQSSARQRYRSVWPKAVRGAMGWASQ